MFKLSPLFKANYFLHKFARNKVPMISYCKPKVIALDADSIEIKIPLTKRTKNHLNCMYFGALSVGADITSGFLAMIHIQQSSHNIQLLFKDFDAQFHKRAEGDVHFLCRDGLAIKQLIKKAIQSVDRQNMSVLVEATVPSISSDLVASFKMTLSIKEKAP